MASGKSHSDSLCWKTEKKEFVRIVIETGSLLIGQASNGKKILSCKKFVPLSSEEREFAEKALWLYRNNGFASAVTVSRAIEEQATKDNILLESDQKQYIETALNSEVKGLGPFDFLADEQGIEEISVTGIWPDNPVRVYHSEFGWIETNIYLESEQKIIELANRLALSSNRRLSLSSPRLNCELSNGSRMNAVVHPLAKKSPSITIRNFQCNRPNPSILAEWNVLSFECLAFLWLAIESDCSLLIAGNTGSGKTTLLNSLLCFIPEKERIVTIEETPELVVPHEHSVRLVSGQGNSAMEKLILDTLRMRPDRIIAGEIRSPEETKAFENTLIAGQGKGSYATFHGLSLKDAVSRLIEQGFRKENLGALDLIALQKRWTVFDKKTGNSREERRLVELAELSGTGKAACGKTLFRFSVPKGAMDKTRRPEKTLEKIMASHSFTKKEYGIEIKKRADILQRLSTSKKWTLQEYMKMAQEMAKDA